MTPTHVEGIAAIDTLPADAAARLLAPFVEGAPTFLARLIAERPFATWDALWTRARDVARAMPEAGQVELLDAHPRLGAPRELVSRFSAGEQGLDGPAAGSVTATPSAADATSARLAELNAAYEARFGFRYCVFVAGRPLDALIPGFEAALAADRDAELRRGLAAVVDIARARQARTNVFVRAGG